MNAGFFKRLVSYFIDIILVSLIASIISMGIKTSAGKYQEELADAMSNYMSGTITMEQYMEKTNDLTYEIQKRSVIPNTISLVMTVGYFIVFQYLNKGQTIGKKLMKIKVVDNESGKEPGVGAFILRSIIILNIISSLFNIIFVNVLNKSTFMTGTSAITWIEEAVLIISVIMILYRKDKRGLQDIVARTKVIEEVM